MKKIATYVLVFACFSTLAVLVSNAQTVGLRVDIPFNFNVAERALPAGQYLILAPQGGTLRITGPNGAAALTMTNEISGRYPLAGPGAVVFNCYGKRCFLAQFWTARTQFGQEIGKCRLEKELAREREQVASITLKGSLVQ